MVGQGPGWKKFGGAAVVCAEVVWRGGREEVGGVETGAGAGWVGARQGSGEMG